ncbi:peptidase M13 [Gallaecimonas kandeliae]|uniref:M13 family metallopeptidase n=1 Tax=Gallaecimonas kandeliae TaxID=3029055 RepID=UPI0026475B1D|nr:M13-type metalloendopeptidase [Gallaecimonas kandeliae]WKE66119.1 peptidase M13 [Gallaecimonas kandeliae]
MTKLSHLALAVALGLGLGACAQQTETAQAPQAAAPAQKQLVSGIDLANFDKSVSPKNDFYHYVDGTWLKNTPIPADKSNYGSFSKLYDDSQQAMKTIIEEAAAKQGAADGSNDQKIGDFYKSYMNTDLVEKLGLSPIEPELNAIRDLDSLAGVSALMGKLALEGVREPFGFYVGADAKDSLKNAAYVDQSGLGLPNRDYYLDKSDKYQKIRDAYVSYISDQLKNAGFDNTEKRAKSILALETQLAKAQWDKVKNRDPNATYNKVSAAELGKTLKTFYFDQYAQASGLDKAHEVIVGQPSYFEDFGKLFGKVPVETWKSYLAFHLVDNYGDVLPKAIADRHFDFHGKLLSGTEEQSPRWKQAVDATDGVLGMMVGKEYVARYFKPEAKARMEKLVQNLLKAYGESIDELEWMSPATKEAAKAKLAKFTPKVGYPDKWKSYDGLTIKADDLVGNFRRYAAFEYQDMLNKLDKPVDRSEWGMTPQTINAYYNPLANEIVFPAAILQPPFFNMDADDAVNYGGIGAVIGHEIGHGFDDSGANFDGDGNLRNWWTKEDLKKFKERTGQLAAQYSSYAPFSDAHVNGNFTLGENIGDLGGLTMAYKAYQMSLNGKEAPVIDGFTGDQRFFIGWAQVWRRNYREANLRMRLNTDPHSPSQYRANGTVGNVPAFYKAFDIQPGDKMYIAPDKRVKIW